MIVDDDDDLRGELAFLLQEHGYRVLSAPNGSAAMGLLQSRIAGGELLPSLILLDLSMPEMDGWQLRHALEQDPRLASLPLVVMTAAREQSPDVLNVRAVIAKPFPLRDLVAVLERCSAPAQSELR